MIYLLHKTVNVTLDENAKERIKSELKDSFEINDENKHLSLTRNRIIGNRGIFRILFPKCVTKLVFSANQIKYKVKLDGVAFTILIIAIGAVLVEFLANREAYPRKYPIWVPYAFLVWYLLSMVIELYRIQQKLLSIFAKIKSEDN